MTSQDGALTDQVLLIDYGGGDHGHRAQFNAALGRLFNLSRPRFGLRPLFSRRPILVPAIEHGFGLFVLTSLVRALLGRRTAGIMMRPLPALRGTSMRLRSKRLALSILRRFSAVSVITMVPFTIEPELERIARGWIDDVQNWDLQLDPQPALEPDAVAVVERVRNQAGRRKVCCAIGYQNSAKGFDRLVRLWNAAASARTHILLAYGGRVAPGLERAAADFEAEGGYGINRFVSDSELIGLYSCADLVWCVYDPEYDQASGILGRALQNGVPVAVRKGSVVHRLCLKDSHPHVVVDEDSSLEALLVPVAPLAIDAARARARAQGERALGVLRAALGLAPGVSPFTKA